MALRGEFHTPTALHNEHIHQDSGWVFPTNKRKETKLINRKQAASPSRNSTIPLHGCAQKHSLDRWSGMPVRTEIKIKLQILKRNQTSTHTYPDRLSTAKRGREREGSLLPSLLVTEVSTEWISQTSKTKTKLIKLSPFQVATNRLAMPK